MQDQIEKMLSGIKPLLAMQGKDISILEATEERVLLMLTGFCGDCGCSMNYAEGLKDMIGRQFPNVKAIEFEMSDAA